METRVLYITYMGLTEPLIESQSLAYLKGLSGKGNDIFILSFEKDKFITKERIAKIKRELEELNIHWFFLKYHKRPAFFAKVVDLLAGFIFSFCIVITKDIDIIHTRGSMPAFFAFFVTKVLRRKFVFDMRGLMAMEYADGSLWKRGGFYYNFANKLEKVILRYSDAIVVLTEKIKSIVGIKPYTGIDIFRKISVIATAVDTNLFNINHVLSSKVRKRMELENRFVFLYVGSLGTWYMFEEMAKFIKINSYNFRNPFFLIVTQSDAKEAKVILQRLEFKSTDYAIIYSEHKEIPTYINLSDAGMMFIRPCFSKEASCPTKFAEYLACGIPVVLNSGIGDCNRIIRDYNVGVLVDSFEENKYIDAGMRLKRMIEAGDGISKRCRELACKEFSLDGAVDDYNKIYKKFRQT